MSKRTSEHQQTNKENMSRQNRWLTVLTTLLEERYSLKIVFFVRTRPHSSSSGTTSETRGPCTANTSMWQPRSLTAARSATRSMHPFALLPAVDQPRAAGRRPGRLRCAGLVLSRTSSRRENDRDARHSLTALPAVPARQRIFATLAKRRRWGNGAYWGSKVMFNS